MELFNFNGKELTVATRNDVILFDPKEVGMCLELKENTIFHKLQTLDEGIEKIHFTKDEAENLFNSRCISNTSSSNFGKTYLTEQGVYQFVMESRSQEAKKFKTWICREVLPSIRKHGMYATPMTIDNMIANPAAAIKLLEALQREKEEKRVEQEARKRAEESQRIEQEARERAEKERLWIRSKAEATAMATASVAKRQIEKLKERLGEGQKRGSTLAVSIMKGSKVDIFPWHPLKKYCVEHDLSIVKIFDPRFGQINTYPSEAWKKVYDIDLSSIF